MCDTVDWYTQQFCPTIRRADQCNVVNGAVMYKGRCTVTTVQIKSISTHLGVLPILIVKTRKTAMRCRRILVAVPILPGWHTEFPKLIVTITTTTAIRCKKIIQLAVPILPGWHTEHVQERRIPQWNYRQIRWNSLNGTTPIVEAAVADLLIFTTMNLILLAWTQILAIVMTTTTIPILTYG